jgi:hypothetical protein
VEAKRRGVRSAAEKVAVSRLSRCPIECCEKRVLPRT